MFRRLLGKNKWPEFPIEELRKRSKLLVIDDQDFPYLELFNRDEYNIEKWDDIKDLNKLERGYFDIILLDIQGVGREVSYKEQGFGVLKHLRNSCPTQIIIAYSNESWSFKYSEFFDLADARLDKNDDYVVFKEKIDLLLKDRFSIGFYLHRIETIISPYDIDTKKIIELSSRAIFSKDDTKLDKYLRSILDNKEAISIILKIVSIAIATYTSFNG